MPPCLQATARAPRRPSVGRPKPLSFSSVFLLTPESQMKLDGFSLRAAFKADGKEYLYKVFDQVMQGRWKGSPEAILRLWKRIFSQSRELPPPDVLKLIRALEGDSMAQAEVAAWGDWGAYRAGVSDRLTPYQLAEVNLCIEIEQASCDALLHLQHERFGQTADAIRTEPVIRPYMNDAALLGLANATSPITALPARVAGMCEFLLAQAAFLDAMTAQDRQPHDPASYADLLGDQQDSRCSPGRELIRWLQRLLECESLGDLLRRSTDQRADTVIDDSTVKRWSSGAVFPSHDKLGQLVIPILRTSGVTPQTEGKLQAIELRHRAARRLNQILEHARRLDQLEASRGGWIRMLDDTTLEAWCRRRYPTWLAHWREQSSATASAMRVGGNA